MQTFPKYTLQIKLTTPEGDSLKATMEATREGLLGNPVFQPLLTQLEASLPDTSSAGDRAERSPGKNIGEYLDWHSRNYPPKP